MLYFIEIFSHMKSDKQQTLNTYYSLLFIIISYNINSLRTDRQIENICLKTCHESRFRTYDLQL